MPIAMSRALLSELKGSSGTSTHMCVNRQRVQCHMTNIYHIAVTVVYVHCLKLSHESTAIALVHIAS